MGYHTTMLINRSELEELLAAEDVVAAVELFEAEEAEEES